MSLGLHLLANLAAPHPSPEQLLERLQDWLQRSYLDLRPKTRRGIVDSAPALFSQLHPAAEEFERPDEEDWAVETWRSIQPPVHNGD